MEFSFPFKRKPEVMKELGTQLKTWRKNLRKTYFGGLDSNGIKALKDRVLPKELIPLSEWNDFITRKASDGKLNQRMQAKANRLKKTDVHTLGRTLYAEKAEAMETILQRPVDHPEVYVESRKKKDENFHPAVADEMNKITELKSSQDSSSQTTIESDALAMFKGKDGRGRTRVVGPVGKTNLKAIAPILSELKRAKTRDVKRDEDMKYVKLSLSMLLNVFKVNGHKFPLDQQIPSYQFSPQQFPTNQFSPQESPANFYSSLQISQHTDSPVPSSFPSNFVGLSNPSPDPSSFAHIYNLSNSKKIASGAIVLSANPGTMVHNHPLLEYERKVYVAKVVPGEENQGLYRDIQGGATTIKEVECSWVVWP